jgi:hypothetical protein
MAANGTPDIRGEQRTELIQDLARGVAHALLAEKYSRHIQAIKQFSARNAGEVAVVQAGINKSLHERLAEVPIADKARRIAVDQLLRDDLLDRLEDSSLDARLRNHYTKTIMALQRAVAEEMGDLRTAVDLTTTKSLADFDEIVLDEGGQFHAVSGTQHNAPNG